jgi:DNA-binding protein HU-beta
METLKKSELVDQIAQSTGLTKTAAAQALQATLTAIQSSLKEGKRISLIGFGSFYVGKRAARNGRNPQTGKKIKIKAANVPHFRPGKGLKDAVN